MDGFLKIKFNQTYACEIVTGYDKENDEVICEDETFAVGEVHEIDVLDDKENGTIDIQFGDGSCLYGLLKTAFDVI
jgi:hypothetical protein